MTDDHRIEMGFGRASLNEVENVSVRWGALADRLARPMVHDLPFETYRVLDKGPKGRIKASAGFITGGPFRDGLRRDTHAGPRHLVMLDLEGMDADDDLAFELASGGGCVPYEAAVYSTVSHSPEAPRFRIVLPVSRPMEADEAVAVSRLVAEEIAGSLEFVDPVSFRTAQMMYLPARCRDGAFMAYRVRGALLDPDMVLEGEPDWREPGALPMTPKERERAAHLPLAVRGLPAGGAPAGAAVDADPRDRHGLAGAFNRTYSVEQAIEAFLADRFVEMPRSARAHEVRYTYVGSTGEGGAVVYDGLWLYSHHATDPYGGMRLSAFDLVRLHLHGHLDRDADEPYGQRPSVLAMRRMLAADARVQDDLLEATIRRRPSLEAFAAPAAPEAGPDDRPAYSPEASAMLARILCTATSAA